MEITNELLAAYAEGNVSEPERNAVRQYLTDNPEQLETVMMMMDEDYDIALEDESEIEKETPTSSKGSFSDICYSAAAFAPRIIPMKKVIESPRHVDKSSFNQRLGSLLDELDL